MKAVRYHRFGPPEVLVLEDVVAPRPGRGQVVVRVGAAALNPKDILVRKGKMRWLSGRGFPRATGFDLAGDVLSVGPGVTRLRVGDPVFGMLDGFRGGAVAEEISVGAGQVALRPAGLSVEEAAAMPLVGLTALQALRDLARVGPGARVCIHGASGGLGTVAIQVARALGGVVTSVSSGRNLGLCRSLGAVETLDYAVDDALARRWDVFMDCFGDHPYARVRRALAPGGRHVSVVPRPRALLGELGARLGLGQARLVVVRPRVADLEQLARWLEAGTVRPVLDRVFPMAEIAEAHRRVETKRARGKVVIRVAPLAGAA